MTKRVKVIAEVGVNHNGDLGLAESLIESAAKTGADFAKFQIFDADSLVTKNLEKAPYQIKNTKSASSHYEMLKTLELSREEFHRVKTVCGANGIKFLSSVFDINSARFLIEDLGADIVKIGSGELTNLPLLHKVASYDVSILLSTGMSTLTEVETAVGTIIHSSIKSGMLKTEQIFRQLASESENLEIIKDKLCLLHCTSNYPAEPHELNVNTITKLQRKFKLDVGYSDHSTGDTSAIAAVSKGVVVIEKHFTLDKNMEGPDHIASLDPHEFEAFVKKIRLTETCLGEVSVSPTNSEKITKKYARKGLYAKNSIRKGDVFREEDIDVLRPETEVPLSRFWSIIGKKCESNIQAGAPILMSSIEQLEEEE